MMSGLELDILCKDFAMTAEGLRTLECEEAAVVLECVGADGEVLRVETKKETGLAIYCDLSPADFAQRFVNQHLGDQYDVVHVLFVIRL